MSKTPLVSKIVCGFVDKVDLVKLNEKIDKLTEEGYIAENISMANRTGYATEICVLLRKKILIKDK